MPLFNPTLIFLPGMISGQRYGPDHTIGGSFSTSALSANTIYATPFMPVHASRVPGLPVAFDRIAHRFTAASAAGKKGRMGVYATLATGYPGALISGSDSGEFAEDTGAGFDVDQTVSFTLISGQLYWLAVVGDGAPTATAIASDGTRTGTASAAVNDSTPRSSYSGASVYTAGVSTMPDPCPAMTGGSSVQVRILLRVV